MNMKNKISLIVLIVIFFVSSSVFANSVNCDMEYYDYPTYVGTAAAPDTGTYWNSLVGSENDWIYTDLIASDGTTPTPIGLKVLDPKSIQLNAFQKDGSGNNLLGDYWYNYLAVDTVQISGLHPGKTYSLYCYGASGVELQSGGQGRWGFGNISDPNDFEIKAALGLYIIGPIPPADWTETHDHVIFNKTANSNGIINGIFGGGDLAYGNWNGLQIVWEDDVDINVGDGLSVLETGPTSDSFSVALASSPANDVNITIIPDAQVTVDPCSLTFTSGDWNTPQPVTVTAVDDALIEGPHMGIILHSAASADPSFDGVIVSSVQVAITDNESGPVPSGLVEVDEDDPSIWVPYSVTLSKAPTSNVNVTVIPDTQVKIDIDPNTPAIENVLTFTPGGWDAPKNVYVQVAFDFQSEGFPGVDRDGDGEGPLGVELTEAGWHTSTINHTCSSSDLGFDGSSKTHTVYVMDNEKYCRDGVNHTWLEGDVNFDCYVDIEDIKEQAQEWVQCTDPVSGLDCVPFP